MKRHDTALLKNHTVFNEMPSPPHFICHHSLTSDPMELSGEVLKYSNMFRSASTYAVNML